MSNRILRNFLMIGLAASLGAVGCGSDDDDGGSGGSGGTAATGGGGGAAGSGTGGSAGSGTGGAAGSGTGGAAGSGTGGAAGSGTGGAAGGGGAAGSGTGGAAGGGGAGGAGSADAFCTQFNTTCKFSDTTYKNMNDCKTKFEAYSTTRQACVVQHLGLAATDATTHCPHAAGAGPCAAN